MIIDSHDLKLFTNLGLTSIQAEVYLVLVRVGQAEVKIISKNLQIDRAQVYRALPNLEKLGLIQKILAKPTKYKAIPLDQAFPILIDRQTRSIDNIQVKAENFIDRFGKNAKELSTKEEPKYIIDSGSPANTNKVKHLVDNLQTSLDVIFSWEILRNILTVVFREEYKRALRRGIKVRIITGETKNSEMQTIIQPLKEIGSIEVRKAPLLQLAAIAIYDKKIVDFVTSNPNTETLRSTHEELVSTSVDYFELKWRSAQTTT